jgi:hypothetical protein
MSSCFIMRSVCRERTRLRPKHLFSGFEHIRVSALGI